MKKLYIVLIGLFVSISPLSLWADQPVPSVKQAQHHYVVVRKPKLPASQQHDEQQEGYKVVMCLNQYHLIAAGFIGLCAGIGLVYGSYKIYSYYPQIINALHAYQTIRKNPWIIKVAKNIQRANSWCKSAPSRVSDHLNRTINTVDSAMLMSLQG